MLIYYQLSQALSFLFERATSRKNDQYGHDRISHNHKCIFNLATVGLLAVLSGFNSVATPQTLTQAPVAPVVTQTAQVVTVKDQVKAYFADEPIMISIAYCESRDRQTDRDGNIFRGNENHYDVGVMQINEMYHLDTAKKLGDDIYTLDGNMAYARYLYEKQGTAPWISSRPCWGSMNSASDIAMK